MELWIIVVGFVIVCLAVLMYTRKGKLSEGFSGLSEQIAFLNSQNVYYHDTTADKGFFVNPSLMDTASKRRLNEAIAQPELYLP